MKGYEPVVYRDGKWKIKPGAASIPVVRATPTGAMAYAGVGFRSVAKLPSKDW